MTLVSSATLGRTGFGISRLGLGTMTFGRQCDEATSHAILDAALDAGITFVDTADIYPFGGSDYSLVGRSEMLIGSWLPGRRDRVMVATKFGAPIEAQGGSSGGSRRHVLRAVEGSLRRLRTDFIDLYQMHVPDAGTPIEETLSALMDLVRAGKVRYLGCSNFSAYGVARALGHSERLGLERFQSVQTRYNLLFRQPERDLLQHCAADSVSVLPYNPLAGGLLSGKYKTHEEAPDGTRYANPEAGYISRQRYWHDAERSGAEAVREIAARVGVSSVTLALAWLMAQPAVTAPIIGVSRPDQLDAAVAALDFVMNPEVAAELDVATAVFRRGDASL